MSALVDKVSTPDPREEKLPMWARTLLNEQRRVVRECWSYANRTVLATHPDESTAVLHPYGEPTLGLPPVGLGAHAQVRFRLPSREDYRAPYVDVRVWGDHLELRSGDRLAMRPISGNSVNLWDVR